MSLFAKLFKVRFLRRMYYSKLPSTISVTVPFYSAPTNS
jgi:hypothetical protein